METVNDDRPLVLDAARHALDGWADRVEPLLEPGLLALVDRHVAAVRDCLTDPFGQLSPVALAAYADGVADVATARGWSAADGTSWASLRLLAVCRLHRSAC